MKNSETLAVYFLLMATGILSVTRLSILLTSTSS